MAGVAGKQLEEVIANAISLPQKVEALQQYLMKQLMRSSDDLIFEFCVEKIMSSKGKITVKELVKKTGYSSRWLNMKFADKIGMSPKNLSSIIRFSQCYQVFNAAQANGIWKGEFYEYYHDQSHFIKNFKHFTGLSPSRIEQAANDFGRKYFQV